MAVSRKAYQHVQHINPWHWWASKNIYKQPIANFGLYILDIFAFFFFADQPSRHWLQMVTSSQLVFRPLNDKGSTLYKKWSCTMILEVWLTKTISAEHQQLPKCDNESIRVAQVQKWTEELSILNPMMLLCSIIKLNYH